MTRFILLDVGPEHRQSYLVTFKTCFASCKSLKNSLQCIYCNYIAGTSVRGGTYTPFGKFKLFQRRAGVLLPGARLVTK